MTHESTDRLDGAGPDVPELARAGSRAGIASAFAYLALRARLFRAEPQARLDLGGHYTLLDKLGEGASGVVFVAADTRLMRKVAIKVLRTPGDPQGRARLFREAQHLAQLNHPHVLQVYEAGEHRGEIYLAMEYVEGAPLDRWIAESRPDLRARLDALCDVARGLAAAHAAGVIHRDVKPANILVGKDGRARIGDFGLAWIDRSLGVDEAPAPWAETVQTQPCTMSQSGAGTPAYMSPEQLRREDLDARSDLFSFCVVAWEALFGRRPHDATTLDALASAICAGRIAEPAARPFDVPARLEALLRRGLAPDRRSRPTDMTALVGALDGLRHRRSRRGLALAAAFGAGVVLAGSRVLAGTCEDLGLAAQWSAAAREEVRAALPDRRLAGAVVERLDTFVAALADTGAALCRQHRDGSLDDRGYARGRGCLAGREEALRAVLATLREAGATSPALTPDDVSLALGSVSRCGDPGYLTARVEPPTREQEAGLVAVEGSRAEGRAELLRGRFPAAADAFARAVARAREVGHEPAIAESLFDLGRTLMRLRRGAEARAALREAQILADGAGDSFIAADASLLLQNAAVATHDLAAAEWHEGETLARLRQGRRDRGGALGELDLARADRLLRGARIDDAEAALRTAKERLLDDPPELGLWRYNLPRMEARLAAARGDPQAAAARSAEAWQILAAEVGAGHPLYAEELGRAELEAGDLDAAERDLSRARTLYADALGPDSVHVVSVDVALARLYDARDRPAEVARIAARADAILRLHPDEPMTLDERVEVASFLGREQIAARQYAAALASFEGGVAALARHDVPAHGENFALLAASSADLLVNVGELRDVRRAAERIAAALARWPAARHDEHPDRAVYLRRVAADVALAAGDPEAAREHAEAGLERLAAAPREAPRLRWALAQALGRDNPKARGLATAARDDFAGAGRPRDAAEIQQWLDGAR